MMDILIRKATEDPGGFGEPAPDVPPPMAQLVMRMLARPIDARPQTMTGAAAEMQKILRRHVKPGSCYVPSPSRSPASRAAEIPIAKRKSSGGRRKVIFGGIALVSGGLLGLAGTRTGC
jgi:hypothetical protein